MRMLMVAFFLVSVVFVSECRAGFSGYGLYGRTSRFWDTVDLLSKSPSTSEAAQTLDDRFGVTQEGIASLKLSYQNLIPNPPFEWTKIYRFGLRGDWLTGGILQDRIYPKAEGYMLRTAAIEVGVGETGFRDDKVNEDKSTFLFDTTAIFGAGDQTLVKGTISDFIKGIKNKSSTIFFFGFDLSTEYNFELAEGSRGDISARLLPTYFYSEYPYASNELRLENDRFTLRWRIQSEWAVDIIPLSEEVSIEAGVKAILGQNPTPNYFLPRSWDALHSLSLFPSFGQLVGLDTFLGLTTKSNEYKLRLDGGFFGGYFGTGVELYIKGFQIFAGTWGIEQTVGYRITESRIQYLGIGYMHAF